jgi:hypothetical protein
LGKVLVVLIFWRLLMNDRGKQIRLTAGEMGQLWFQYLNDSASVCVLTFFLEKVEDSEIKPMIEYT